MEDISRRQLLGIAAGALVGGLGGVFGNTDADETQRVFRTDSFKHLKLIDQPLINRPYVSNIAFSIDGRGTLFNMGNPSFSYPVALGIRIRDAFDGMLKLTLVNVDTHETVFCGGGRVKSNEKLNERGVHYTVNRGMKDRLAPFYLYRAEWEMDGVYLSCLSFGRVPKVSDIKGK